jgi:hypothetical protein
MSQPTALEAAPTHRYSFTANANDSIGTAHGTLVGHAVITNGNLLLNGTNGCVQMPANLFTNAKSLTLEVWFNHNQVTSGKHLWQFSGSPTIGFQPWVSLLGLWYSRSYYGSSTPSTMVDAPPLLAGKSYHLVWTQDEATKTARVFLNGQLSAQNTNFTAKPGTTTTVSFLGGGSSIAPIKGSITEFRIHSNALTHLDVLRSAALGTEALPVDGDTITNLQLRVASHLAQGSLMRPPVFADFIGQPETDITYLSEIIFSSGDTNVLNPTTNSYLAAVGLGVTELTAAYGGYSATTMVSVVAADQFALAHRYEFSGRWGRTNLADLAGNAPGSVYGGAVLTNTTMLYLDGSNDYVDLPDGILSSLAEVTIETWVTGFSLNGKWWPRVFDFGSGVGKYFFLAPSVQNDNLGTNIQFIRFGFATNGIVTEVPRLTAKPWMVDGYETHLAVTYSPTQNISRLYVNGVLADSGLARYPLSVLVDTNNWLGRSQFQLDAYFQGVFDEFRIYRTALEPAQIAASYALGPEVIGADYALRSRVAETHLVLSWGPSASWCLLQTTASLAPGAVWTTAAVTPVFTNGQMEATLPVSATAQFFRLSSP